MNDSLEKLLQKAEELYRSYVNCDENTREISDIQEVQNIYQKIVEEQPDDYRAWEGLMWITPYIEGNIEFAGTSLKVYRDLAFIRASDPEIKKDIERNYQEIKRDIYGYTPKLMSMINSKILTLKIQIKNESGLEKARTALYLKYLSFLAEARFPLSSEDEKILSDITLYSDLLIKRMGALKFREATEAIEKYEKKRQKLSERKVFIDEFKYKIYEILWKLGPLVGVVGFFASSGISYMIARFIIPMCGSIIESMIHSGNLLAGLFGAVLGIVLGILVLVLLIWSIPFMLIYYFITGHSPLL